VVSDANDGIIKTVHGFFEEMDGVSHEKGYYMSSGILHHELAV
jgi:hypothetical protein